MKNFVHANALKLEEIGERIRLRRKKLKYTLEDIEKATGISRKTLIKLEKGGDVRFSTLTTVLSILGLTLDWSDQTKHMFSDRLGDRNDGWY
jgi:transcriptional regulator with XRE-family HTH domain